MSVFAGLEPAGVWDRFAELTRIARPPKEEAQVREHVLALGGGTRLRDSGRRRGQRRRARAGDSSGRERAPTVVLQAHLDMVCERDPDSPYDPRAGRINVVVDGDWVVAEGTTLGADNGIGVAAAMAVAEDATIEHGPLELLFTVSEEQGLDGAKALDPSLVTRTAALNLDGTSDEAITVGCAGSTHTFTRLPLPLEPVPDGLRHARRDGLGRARRPLWRRHREGPGQRDQGPRARARARTPFRLARLEGGVSRNALPREARAVVAVRAEDEFRDAAERELAAIREQYAGTDDGLELSIELAEREPAADEATSARALDLLGDDPERSRRHEPESPRHGRDEHEPQRREHRRTACSRSRR